jgi:hypothetical protein
MKALGERAAILAPTLCRAFDQWARHAHQVYAVRRWWKANGVDL